MYYSLTELDEQGLWLQCASCNRFGFELQVREVKKSNRSQGHVPLPYVSDGPYVVWGTGVPTAWSHRLELDPLR